MQNIMLFDEKMKTRTGIICFLPIVSFSICLVYYLTLILVPSSQGVNTHTIITATSQNYGQLFTVLAISGFITAAVLIYCIVILARLKELKPGTKILWIVFLSVTAPLGIAIFWLLIIRYAAKATPVYNDID